MKKITVHLQQARYDICIERGLINKIGSYIRKTSKGHRLAIVTDDTVQNIYGDILNKQLIEDGFKVKNIILADGEESKSINTMQTIYEELLDFHMTREDLIISLGGGVAGDVGGFAAATYLRGVDFVQIPTSLLAQIDSSVGGKVGINLPRGKNLIGSFYQPKAVFIDPDVLGTLNKESFSDGMAEAIKYACILDENLFKNLMEFSKRDLMNNIEDVIYTCCAIKGKLVEEDEKDQGKRVLLNFGHTLGHAIEKYFDYKRYSHGQAVAIGMQAMTKRTEALGLTKKGTSKQLEKILEKYQLEDTIPKVDPSKTMKIIGLDKKSKGDYIEIIILEEIGKAKTIQLKLSDFEDNILHEIQEAQDRNIQR